MRPVAVLAVCLAVLGSGASAPATDAPGTEPVRPSVAYFPLGVFEDANRLMGDAARFRALLDDLKSHGLDSVLLMHGLARRDAALLEIAEQAGVSVFMQPTDDLKRAMQTASAGGDLAAVKRDLGPLVEALDKYRALKGWIVADEPGLDRREPVKRVTRALQELDALRAVMPILIGTDRVGPIFTAALPDVMLIDVYPCGHDNAVGDFTLTGFGYTDLDFVKYVRVVTRTLRRGRPLWLILQTHRFGAGTPFALREPTPAEVRCQNWLAVGEGGKGIFWFIYGSQQGWLGLADNARLFSEVGAQAKRTRALAPMLLGLTRIDTEIATSDEKDLYLSTLSGIDQARFYVVAVNRDCRRQRVFAIKPKRLSARLKDAETGTVYTPDLGIEFAPGDGKVLELVDAPAK